MYSHLPENEISFVKVVQIWEHEWRTKRKGLSLSKRYMYPLEDQYRLTPKEIVKAIKSDKIFGVAEVDIHVPGDLKKK